MWALRSGKITSGEIGRTLVYFIFALEFGFAPEAVDKMPCTLVDSILYLWSEIKKEESRNKQTSMRHRTTRRLR